MAKLPGDSIAPAPWGSRPFSGETDAPSAASPVVAPTPRATPASPPHSRPAAAGLRQPQERCQARDDPRRAHHHRARRGATPTIGATLMVAMATEGLLQVIVRPRHVRRVVAVEQPHPVALGHLQEVPQAGSHRQLTCRTRRIRTNSRAKRRRTHFADDRSSFLRIRAAALPFPPARVAATVAAASTLRANPRSSAPRGPGWQRSGSAGRATSAPEPPAAADHHRSTRRAPQNSRPSRSPPPRHAHPRSPSSPTPA
jgi:hypothetical protein